jgi:hypothetical protein
MDACGPDYIGLKPISLLRHDNASHRAILSDRLAGARR